MNLTDKDEALGHYSFARRIEAVIVVLLFAVLSACGPSAAERRTEIEIAKIRDRLRQVEQSLDQSTNSIAHLKDAQRELASAVGRATLNLDAVRERLKSTTESKTQETPEHEIRGEIFIVTKGRTNVRLGAVDVFVFEKSAVTPILRETRMAVAGEIGLAESRLRNVEAVVAQRQADYDKLQPEYAAWMKKWRQYHLKYLVDEGERLRAQIRSAEAAVFGARKDRDAAVEGLGRARSAGGPRRYIDALKNPIQSTKSDSDGRFALRIPRDCEPMLVAWADRLAGGEEESYHWIVPIKNSGGDRSEISLSNHNLFEAAALGF